MTERQYSCAVDATLDIIGGRWKGLIVYFLLKRPRRFGELKRLLPKISARILTLQLRELERDSIVHREVFKQVPPKVEYSVTKYGQTLETIIREMESWGDKYMDEIIAAKKKQTAKIEGKYGFSRDRILNYLSNVLDEIYLENLLISRKMGLS